MKYDFFTAGNLFPSHSCIGWPESSPHWELNLGLQIERQTTYQLSYYYYYYYYSAKTNVTICLMKVILRMVNIAISVLCIRLCGSRYPSFLTGHDIPGGVQVCLTSLLEHISNNESSTFVHFVIGLLKHALG